MTEILVFGVDGFSNQVIQMLGEEKMPNIHKLQNQEQTVYGDFESYTIPESPYSVPLTGPCWTSLYTGLKPEQHGLLSGGWEQGDSRFHEMYTVWDKLSEENISMALWGMPMTYKAKEINGFMMSGFVHPVIKSLQNNLLYPDNLEQEIIEACPRTDDWLEMTSAYMAKVKTEEGFKPDMPETPEQALKMYHNGEWDRLETLVNIYNNKEEKPDIVAFGTTWADKMGHTSAGINPTNNTTRKTYEEVDKMLGELIDETNPDEIVIISDHGFSGHSHDELGYYLDTTGEGMKSIFDFTPWLLNQYGIDYNKNEYGPIDQKKDDETRLSQEEREDIMDGLEGLGYKTNQSNQDDS